MPTTAELALLISAKDNASKTLDGVGKAASGLGKVLGDVGKIAGGFLAANVVAGGVQKLTGFMGDSVTAIKESIAVGAQLDAVLKSTGGAAGLTANQVKEMAAGMEKLSLFEDEAIISSSNLLLTFTNIGKDVFPQAQQAVIDMSQALGQDLKSSSVQLGKALNDPINGITALSRVGVSFTEEQKTMIEGMVEAGDVAGAQAVILAELTKEFGGSAQAASDAAGAAERHKDKINDLKEEIGAKLLPIQEKWQELQTVAVAFIIDKVLPALETFAKYIAFVWTEGDTMNDWLANLPEPLQGVAKAIGEVALFLKNEFWPAFQSGLDVIVPLLKDFVNFVIDNKPVLIAAIAAVGAAVVLALGPVSLTALALTGIITAVGLVKDNWTEFETFASQLWGRIALSVAQQVNKIIEAYNSLPLTPDIALFDEYALKMKAIGEEELPDIARGLGTSVADGIIRGLAEGQPAVDQQMKEMAQSLEVTANEALQIQSPSKVFARIGADTIAGLVEGLKKAGAAPRDYMIELVDGMWKVASEAHAGTSHRIISVGASMGEDIAKGIRSSVPAVASAAREVIDSAAEAWAAVDGMRARNAGPGPASSSPVSPLSTSTSSPSSSVPVLAAAELRGTARLPSGITVINNVYGSIHSDKDITRVVRDAVLGGGFRGVIASPEAT